MSIGVTAADEVGAGGCETDDGYRVDESAVADSSEDDERTDALENAQGPCATLLNDGDDTDEVAGVSCAPCGSRRMASATVGDVG